MRVNPMIVSTSSFTGSSQLRKKGATLAGTHVPRLFDHLLASRVVLRCPHCFWAWPAVFKFARFELGASPNPGVHRWVRGGEREKYRAVLRIMRKGFERVVVPRWRRRSVHGVILPAYRGFRAWRETKGKGARKGREKEGKRRREGDNDWNKIFTAAAGAGP